MERKKNTLMPAENCACHPSQYWKSTENLEYERKNANNWCYNRTQSSFWFNHLK